GGCEREVSGKQANGRQMPELQIHRQQELQYPVHARQAPERQVHGRHVPKRHTMRTYLGRGRLFTASRRFGIRRHFETVGTSYRNISWEITSNLNVSL